MRKSYGSRFKRDEPAPRGLKLIWVLFRDTFRYDPSGRERLSTQLIFVIGITALALGAWSTVMEIDQVISAEGKLISSAKLQTIEHFEGGRIEAIHVKAGDQVKPGDLLLTLSPIQAQNELTVSNQQSALLQIRAARIEAELQGANTIQLPLKLTNEFADTLRTETKLLRERQAQLASGIKQRDAEIASIEARLKAAMASKDAIEQERLITARLVDRGLEPRISLIRIERSIAEASGAIAQAQEEIGKTRASIQSLRDEYRSNLVAELAKVQNDLVGTRASVTVTKDKLERSLLKSPAEGTVNRVLVSTVGGTVKPGERVIEIVPNNAELLLEARVAPQSIGYLSTGQRALIKFATYDFAIYGAAEGEVAVLGSDSVLDEKGMPFFLVQIRLPEGFKPLNDLRAPLIPGMTAQVDVITGKRTVFSYVFSPITRTMQSAFRER